VAIYPGHAQAPPAAGITSLLVLAAMLIVATFAPAPPPGSYRGPACG
jgi:hypothetical protein